MSLIFYDFTQKWGKQQKIRLFSYEPTKYIHYYYPNTNNRQINVTLVKAYSELHSSQTLGKSGVTDVIRYYNR